MVSRLRSSRRDGVSLVELLVASTVMVLIAAAFGSVSYAVKRLSDYASGTQETVQHARVVMETFRRTVNGAYANLSFPGVVVFAERSGTDTLPETLVVWSPDGQPADPNGLPRFSELMVFCPNPKNPAEFVVISNRQDARAVPPLDDSERWANELLQFKRDNVDQAMVLTNRLRTVVLGSADPNTGHVHGLVRFFVEQRPSSSEFAELSAGDKTWGELAWPLDLYNSEAGIARCRCNLEFQLAVAGSEAEASLAFFDAAATQFVVESPARTAQPVSPAQPSLSPTGP